MTATRPSPDERWMRRALPPSGGEAPLTLNIELTPEEERRVRSAQAKGLDVTAMIKGLLAGLPEVPETEHPEDKTLAILAQWQEEDATEDLDELTRRDAELAEFKANMNAHRFASGEEPLFP
jgi:hypothetical protein